jgi:hypothetical protein
MIVRVCVCVCVCVWAARTAGVFYLPSPQGIRYQMNLTGAQNGCSQQGATLASFKQLADAQQVHKQTRKLARTHRLGQSNNKM